MADGYDEAVEYHPPRKSYCVRVNQDDFHVVWADDAAEAIEYVRDDHDVGGELFQADEIELSEDNIDEDPVVISSDYVRKQPFVPNWQWVEKELTYKPLGLEELARKNGHCLPCSQELGEDEDVRKAIDPNYVSEQKLVNGVCPKCGWK